MAHPGAAPEEDAAAAAGPPLEDLAAMCSAGAIAVLTGAGISTDSGIPDYRSPPARPHIRPTQHGEFIADPAARRRYWMRSMLGWPRVAAARPNTGHRALAALERAGALVGIITQNVDRLHQRAGSQHIVELHGALAEVLCLACGEREPRAAVQERLLAANRALHARAAAPEHAPGPDGDTEVPAELLRDFRVPTCLHCDGILKPDVVFFGGSVPRPRVARCQDWIERAAALLVVGSSLAVFSGLRFVRQAAARGIPVAILNRGPTRGDPLATLRLDAGAGPTLERLATLLGCRS